MEPFKKKNSNSWILSVSVIALIVGFLASVAWITNLTGESRFDSVDDDVRDRIVAGRFNLNDELVQNQTELTDLRDELSKAREENTTLQQLLSTETAGSKELSAELSARLQEAKLYSGLTEVEGQGVEIILRDSVQQATNVLDPGAGIIHDTDVLKVVNELWNSGAEAVSVNGHRVGPRTNFRCVGSVILVDSIRIATPVEIWAIGDSQTLLGALNLPGGPLDEIRQTDRSMVQIQRVERLLMEAYAGSMAMKFANTPEKEED